MIGDGCGGQSDAGLSDFGRAVVAEMNRVGVIPDCAHSGWQTSLESAQVLQLGYEGNESRRKQQKNRRETNHAR